MAADCDIVDSPTPTQTTHIRRSVLPSMLTINTIYTITEDSMKHRQLKKSPAARGVSECCYVFYTLVNRNVLKLLTLMMNSMLGVRASPIAEPLENPQHPNCLLHTKGASS